MSDDYEIIREFMWRASRARVASESFSKFIFEEVLLSPTGLDYLSSHIGSVMREIDSLKRIVDEISLNSKDTEEGKII